MIIEDGNNYIVVFDNTRYIGPATGGRFTERIDAEAFEAQLVAENQTEEKDAALSDKLQAIDDYFLARVNADYLYDGHTYKADYLQISGMSQNCMRLTDTDPIPSADGKWSTIELDGINPVRVAFTCAEFVQFATAFAGRRATDFAVKQSHETAVRGIHADENKTAQDILNYDHTTGGWV